jgi:hypothetical protein
MFGAFLILRTCTKKICLEVIFATKPLGLEFRKLQIIVTSNTAGKLLILYPSIVAYLFWLSVLPRGAYKNIHLDKRPLVSL